MESLTSFFSEYDRMQKNRSEEELESWLVSQCEAAEQEHPQEPRLISVVYNEVGSFYKHRGRYEEAEEAFLKSKALWETTEKDANYATIVNNLAGNYRMRGNFDEAAELFRQALELYRKYPQTPKELSSSVYNNLALVYLDTERYQEAVDLLQTASDEMKDSPGCYYEKATTYANMAVAYYRLGETELGDEKIRMADELYKTGGLENSSSYQMFSAQFGSRLRG